MNEIRIANYTMIIALLAAMGIFYTSILTMSQATNMPKSNTTVLSYHLK